MKKKIYGLVLALVVSVFSLAQSANASVIYSQVLDNDDGAIDGPNNMYSHSWTYLTSTNYYRGDARRAVSGTGAEYAWKFNTHSGGRLFYVYLNDLNFNNTHAYYNIIDSNYNGYVVTNFNQDSAPAGWNLITSTLTYNNTAYPYFSVWTIDGNGYTGADGARVDFNN